MVEHDQPRVPSASAHQPILEERLLLPPEPDSASRARRLLRQALAGTPGEPWLDDAELALSEVVTNATLHAHTDMEVLIGLYPDVLCVEVRDFDPTPPEQRDHRGEALTGRGMGLVAAVTRRCGVEPLGEAGKVVWFCVGDGSAAPPDLSTEELLAAWDLDGWQEPAVPENVVVVLPSMPVRLWFAAREHHDAIIRDLGYYLAAHPAEADVDIATADRARSTISATLAATVRELSEGGGEHEVFQADPVAATSVPDSFDLEISVPADGAWMFATMQDVLDTAEALAVEGKLLVQPALPELVAVRDWACEQVVAQLAGVPPTPWRGVDSATFETRVRGRRDQAVSWEDEPVSAADRPVLAADEANRIVAVSRPLADLLGWDTAELVGRRVVTVVPHAHREAHVAGFSRHLSTGEARLLGRDVEFPVLARDGTEIPCRLRIDSGIAGPGRRVFLAWIDPVG